MFFFFFIYTLKTRKYLDFNDWAEAINIKSNSTPSKRKGDYIISPKDMDTIINLKQKMNSKRIKMIRTPNSIISPNWLIGFIEGEGSFFFYLITQKVALFLYFLSVKILKVNLLLRNR